VRSLLAGAVLAAFAFGGYHLAADYRVSHAYKDHLEAAQAARRAGRLDEAGQHLTECTRLRPDGAELPLEQALVRAQGGDETADDRVLKTRLQVDDPDAVLARQALTKHALRALDRGDFLKAYKLLALSLRLAPGDAATQFLAARCARRGQQYERAEQHLEICLRLLGPTPALQLEGLLLRAQQKQLTRDEENQLQSLVDQDHPDSVLILEALTQNYIDRTEFPLAQVCIDKWLTRQPGAVQAYRWRAGICKRLRQYQAAIDNYIEALKQDPRHDPTRLELIEMLLTLKRLKEAAPLLDEIYQRRPDNAKVLLGLAVCRDSEGRFREAQEMLDHLPEQENPHVLVLLERGRVALGLGKPAEAERYLRRAVKIAPRNQEVYYTLFRALNGRDPQGAAEALKTWKKLDKLEEDLRDLRQQLGKRPRDLDLRVHIGTLCLETGKDEEGVEWLEAVLHEDPKHPEIRRILAEYYRGIGRADLAAKHRELARQEIGPKK
jgi:tetratricopeptide (TPR) repeat protein